MSSLRARCSECRTFTAVALGDGYECHRCGRSFGAGLVRVPRAWGARGEGMAAAAGLPIPYPEVGVVECATLEEQSEALAAMLPRKPVVLGGCCCAHVGAVQGLAPRVERLSVVWIDAHGDLNTPESSPSGNLWGMPLRMLLDDRVVAVADVALVGVRNLDPPEVAYVEAKGLGDSVERAVSGASAVYIALDLDVLDPSEADVFVAEPDGLGVGELEAILRATAAHGDVVGVGVTGLLQSGRNIPTLTRLLAAAGF